MITSPTNPAPPRKRWLRGSLLDELPAHTAEELLAQGRPTTFAVGATLAEQGNRNSPPVFVVLTGVVKATRTALPDSPPTLLGLYLPGNVPGAATALLSAQSHVTYTAVKATTAIAVPRDVFVSFMRTRHEALNALCTALAHEVCLRDAALSCATLDVRSRLIAFLARQQVIGGVRTQQGVMLSLGLSQSDFAAAIGASEPAVSKTLNTLKREGVLSIGYKCLYIKKPLSPERPSLVRRRARQKPSRQSR
ncbi:Crp/Fnr family transcriptional regulator [Umezawaea beigongshangensis]|uniref:Crp/Fnr family transcriptional regulator n=1 Tax=Umezawaea beigongshangensis TaxID=2780383 RepID=UPI0018F242EB|nr:Crp/Fnr family transcriptional regulator [Umezawaea beigongshangensis]